jgi:hypothetical protein
MQLQFEFGFSMIPLLMMPNPAAPTIVGLEFTGIELLANLLIYPILF